MMNLRLETLLESNVRPLWALSLILLLVSCSGGGDGSSSGAVAVASFTDSGTAGAQDLITLRGQAAGDEVILEVVLGGPHPTQDLYAFAFQLEVDPAIVQLIGTTKGDLVDPAESSAIASQQGDRIIVGVTTLDPGDPSAVTGAESTVVILTLRVQFGVTTVNIVDAPINLNGDPGPSALDQQGNTLPAITFDTQSASIMGS